MRSKPNYATQFLVLCQGPEGNFGPMGPAGEPGFKVINKVS